MDIGENIVGAARSFVQSEEGHVLELGALKLLARIATNPRHGEDIRAKAKRALEDAAHVFVEDLLMDGEDSHPPATAPSPRR